MLFWITLFVAVLKTWIILTLLTKLILLLPNSLAKWGLKGFLHPFSLFILNMVITWLISLFSGDSAEAGIANLLASIFMAPVYSKYASFKHQAILA